MPFFYLSNNERMQKLVIIRGHSGSGKTTLVKKLMAESVHDYPAGKCFHIENDLFLLNEQSIYEWTASRFEQAKAQVQQAVKMPSFLQRSTLRVMC